MGAEKLKEIIKSTPKIKLYIAVAVICCILLFLMRTPSEKKEDTPEPQPQPVQFDYKKELESELCAIVSEISGAGEAKVMLTLSGSEINVYEKDESRSDGRRESETVIIGSKEALLSEQLRPRVLGVIVLCPGGEKPGVREKVVNAVSTVLDIPTSKVYVAKSK